MTTARGWDVCEFLKKFLTWKETEQHLQTPLTHLCNNSCVQGIILFNVQLLFLLD